MQSKPERVRFDCRHFVGDRPCRLHKAEGVKCQTCSYYDPVKTRVLVIKLGAMGDVLRTTSILPALNNRYDSPHITWVTVRESLGLLENNPWIHSLMAVESASLARLFTETYDLVLNPETAKESAALASMARGKEKKGFGLAPEGYVFPLNQGAEEIFQMGLFDDVKKANRKTYEQLICQLSGLPFGRVSPVLHLTQENLRFGEAFRKKRRLQSSKPVIGLNTGGGGRWPLKQWTTKGFVELARRLIDRVGAQVLLFGGPEEKETNRRILSQAKGNVVDTGCSNSTREFAALLNLCDVVVTGDSLAMHIALALGRRVVVLFGPTSAAEIDVYDRGQKVMAEMDCLCCYRQSCDRSPNCMESLSVDTVFHAVEEETRCAGKR